MKIIINAIPPSGNQFAGRQNVWAYRKLKQEWTDIVCALCHACKDRPKEPYDKAMVTITYYFKDKRRRDADNYNGKLLLDGLTKAGVIQDDSFHHITLVLRGEYDKSNPRTEIEITTK